MLSPFDSWEKSLERILDCLWRATTLFDECFSWYMNWRRSCKEREHGSLDTRQTAISVCKRLQKRETLIWSTHRKKALYLSHPFKIFIQVSLFPECIKAILPILLYGVSLSHKIIIAGLQSVFCLNPRDLQHCRSKGSNLGWQNSCGHKNSFSSFRLICSLNFFSNTYFCVHIGVRKDCYQI